MSSPTSRSLEWLRERGYYAHVVEKRIPFRNTTVDCFGADILAMHAILRRTVLIQATSMDNVSHRVKKCSEVTGTTEKEIAADMERLLQIRAWIQCGNRFFVHGWGKQGPRGKPKKWVLKVVEIL